MKVLLINSFYYNGGSTGRIVKNLYEYINAQGDEAFIAYGLNRGEIIDDYEHIFRFERLITKKIGGFAARLFGDHGFHNSLATRRLCKWIDEVNPDIIHLHNLHGSYVNVEILFDYLKRIDKPIVWTLHDCWAFTGFCAHYSYPYCDKWKTGCYNCQFLYKYPHTYFIDKSKQNYHKKQRVFNGVNKLTIVSPCYWLKNELKDSFLSKYTVEVIHNGIDLSVFRPVNSTFKELRDIKKMMIAVASPWNESKGLNYLNRIANAISGSEWKLVIVGKLDDHRIEKNDNVISVPHTNCVEELVEMYSAADVLINPTLEDTFPTVNIESLACGTPCITFDTGGCKEIITTDTGTVVDKGDWESMLQSAVTCNKNMIMDSCVNNAKQYYDKKISLNNYMNLYRKIMNSGD